jgi:pimeloyl-ACP methyl ester carboxylesterase
VRPVKTVLINDVDIAFDSQGAGPETLVLVHGFTGSSLDWTDVVALLAPHVEVVTYDQRGHGNSTNTGDEATYTFEQLIADLTAFVDSIGLTEPFHLLGHSMGGMVAMRWALAHQQRLRSLILMDTGAEPLAAAEQMFAPMMELAATQGMAPLIDAMERFTPVPDGAYGEELRRRNRWKLEHMDPRAFVGLGREIARVPGVLEQLGQLELPTTVLVGADDAPFVDISARMTATIPGARQVTFAGAGHCPQEDDPAAWADAVLAHLRRA